MESYKSLKYFFSEHKWSYILGIFFLLIVDGLQLLIPEVLRRFTDQIQANQLQSKDLIPYGLYFILIGLGIAFFRFLWRIHIIGVSRELEYSLRNKLFKHLQSLSINYHHHHKTGDLMAHATNDVNAVRNALGQGIVMLTDAIFMSIIAIVMMIITTNYKLTLLALLPLPFLAFTILRFGKLIHFRFKSVQEAFASLTDMTQENLAGIRVIKSFVQEEPQIHQFKKKNQDVFEKNMGLVKLQGMFHPFVEFVSSLSFLIVIFYGGVLVIYGEISLGDFIAFNTYLALLIWPMMAIGWVINVIQRGAASLDRINKILETKAEVFDLPQAQEVKAIEGEIRFERVSFRYPKSNHYALKDFSLTIPAGSSLGVIGKTGSGKSTLAHLLLRLYDLEEGTIFIDKRPLTDYSLHSLRQRVGYVDQDSFLFSTTLAENICFGLDHCSQEIVEKYGKIAQIHDNVMDFPHQYETIVGERGVTLSGGQKQRTSIARALAKDPQILILDDSLSAVDTDTEERILTSLRDELKEKTLILIAHRISTIKSCDHIIVLKDGLLIEQGTHESLLENRGFYHELYQKQLLEEKIQNTH